MAFLLFFVLGLVSVNIDKNEIIELLFLKLGGLNVLSATHSPWDMTYVENGN